MNKEIPTIIDLENTKDNQEQHRLLDMLVPLIEAMPSIDLIKSLNPKQNILVRMNTFIWGYLNQLVTLSAKKISIATTNQKVLFLIFQKQPVVELTRIIFFYNRHLG